MSSLAQASSTATALREAALKSRRHHPKQPLNSRPVVQDNSVQLDYGQAGDSPPPPAPPSPMGHHQDSPDGPAREEGEISDSDSAPTNQPSQLVEPGQLQTPSVKSLVHEDVESLSQSSMSPRAIRTSDCYPTEPTGILVDADHVRPGLTSA
jgi:hypothetical protein